MKIKFENSSFKPITITIETQKELDQLVAMCNHCNFADEYENDVSADIFNELEGFVKTKYHADNGIALYEVTEDEN
jgi:hypothetical protein